MSARLAVRRAALRAALDRRDLGEAAWAAARLRLPGVALDTVELTAARRARLAIGRAIREARRRRSIFGVVFRQPAIPHTLVRLDGELGREIAVVWVLAIVLGLAIGIFQVLQPPEGSTRGGEPSLARRADSGAQAAAGQPVTLRGRTAPEVVAPPPVFEARERPTPPPSPPPPTIAPVRSVAAVAPASPASSAAPRGGAGAGTSGTSQVGTGSGGGPGGSGTAARPPLPKAPPPPAVVPEGFSRVRGRVIDATTGKPVVDVCLVIGVQTCGPFQPYTDETGSFTVDLPIGDVGIFWRIVFTKPGYELAERRIVSASGGVLLGDIKLKPIANGR